jgi:acyl carrier protein
MEDRVKTILSRVLGVAKDSLDGNSSPDTIETWDSSTHLTLVMSLEEEFGVQFTEEQIVQMMNLALIIETLKETGVSA